MRCAITEAVISQKLASNIFRDFYTWDKEAETELSGLRKGLSWLGKEHPKEATIMRCQLAKACNKSCNVEAVATQVAQDICAALRSWLNDDTARRQFAERLKEIFVEAIRIWQHLQKTRQGAMAAMDLTSESWIEETDARPEYNSMALGSEQNSQQRPTSQDIDPLAILFPQIYAGDELLFHGFALFPTQTAVIVASQECNGQRSLRRTTAHRRRTSDMGGGSRTEPGMARQVVNNASGGVTPQRRPSLGLGNSQPLQGRAGLAASVSSRSRRSERDGSGD
jgi:hypothetical protein